MIKIFLAFYIVPYSNYDQIKIIHSQIQKDTPKVRHSLNNFKQVSVYMTVGNKTLAYLDEKQNCQKFLS